MTRLARWLPTTTLFCWGILLLYFFASGRLSAYLHPAFRIYVPVAGVVLLVLGVGSFLGSKVESDHHCHDGCCGSPVAHLTLGRLLTFLVLLAPATVAALSSNDSFGLNAIRNRGVVTSADNLVRHSPVKSSAQAPAPAPGVNPGANAGSKPGVNSPIEVQVTELLYAAQDPTLRPNLEGKSIEVLGQLMPETSNNANGNRFKIVRMFMVCCAADARPVAVIAETEAPPGIGEMSWVKAVGKITFPLEGGRPVPVLKAESVVVSDPPSETMLF
jgi:uncharacterized repeat protein (TIGR03943 family)